MKQSYEKGVYIVECVLDPNFKTVKPKESGSLDEKTVTDSNISAENISVKKDGSYAARKSAKPRIKKIKAQPKKTLEKKDRSKRTYSTLHDPDGLPIVTLLFKRRRFEREIPNLEYAGGIYKFAEPSIIKPGSSISFTHYKVDYIQSNFEITKTGYQSILSYLESEHPGELNRNGKTNFRISSPSFNCLLKLYENEGMFTLQTPIRSPELTKIVKQETRWSKGKTEAPKQKPESTSQRLNRAVYDALVEIYQKFEPAFLNK